MQINTYNPKAFYQLIRTIFFALIVGLLLFLIVVLYLHGKNLTFIFDTSNPFTFVMFLSLIVIPIGFFYSSKVFKSYRPNSTLKDKLPIYQHGLIMRMAFCEAVGLFSIVCILMLANLYFLIFVAIALGAMITNYPSPEKIGEVMELTPTEIDSLRN